MSLFTEILGFEAKKIMSEIENKFTAVPLVGVQAAIEASEKAFVPDTDVVSCEPPKGNAATSEPGMPHTPPARKQTPVATGVLAYFPDAISEVAKVSFIGNEQHNPGQPLHWARDKSSDQTDAAVRHVIDYLQGVRRDVTGNHVLAQAAWRILAELQLSVETEKGVKK